MGSFAMTCGISSLPIEVGDEVYFLLLNENAYIDNLVCYTHSLCYPRTPPLLGKYDDYGSVEKVEDNTIRKVWLEGLKDDLIEQDWGENSCHDVPTSKKMKFDELLNAVWEGRTKYSSAVGPKNIYQVMIRKDVWDALVKIDLEEGPYEFQQRCTLPRIKETIAKAWTQRLEIIELINTKDKESDKALLFLKTEFMDSSSMLGDILTRNGLHRHFNLMANHMPKIKKKEVDMFLQRISELVFINYIMSNVRLLWRPSFANGPQCGEWTAHQKVTQAFSNIIKIEVDKQIKDNEE